MWRAVGALALWSGCLLAPPRPGEPIGGECTMPSEGADLRVVGVFPRDDGDLLVRAGLDYGMQRVNFYDPSATFSPICATRSVELTPLGGFVVDEVLAIGEMSARYLLVLVERSDGIAAVYQIDISVDPPVLTQSAVSGEVGIRPVSSLASPFLSYSESKQEVWFGGPVIQRAHVPGAFGGQARVATVSGQPMEGWYLAAASDAILGLSFVLIGQRADYPAVAINDTMIQAAGRTARDATCDANLAPCVDRIGRAVTSGPPSVAFVPGFSFTRDGDLTAVRAQGGNISLLRGDVVSGTDVVLEDVALHELGASDTSPGIDAIVLTRSTFVARRSVRWYSDAFLGPAPAVTAEVTIMDGGEPERLVVGTFVPTEGPKILVLDAQPGLPDPGGNCFQIQDGLLVDCSFPAR